MVKPESREFNSVQQPDTIELYVEKLKGMDHKTIIRYTRRWFLLLENKKDSDLETYGIVKKINLAIERVIDDVESGNIKASTFRLYKASICCGLAATLMQIRENKDQSKNIDGLNEYFLSKKFKEIRNHFPSDNNQMVEKSTSSFKLKYFPLNFYTYLLDIYSKKSLLEKQATFFLLIKFIRANLLVGLRPIEWLDVQVCSNVETKNLVLIVKNAKNSNGRANGEKRELELFDASYEQTIYIVSFYISFHNRLKRKVDEIKRKQAKLKRSSAFGELKKDNPLNLIIKNYEPSSYKGNPINTLYDKFDRPLNGVAEMVFAALQAELYRKFMDFCKVETGNNFSDLKVSLYSTRHQCIANAKSSKLNIFEIAAFFGHSSTETSSRHYGKAWSGWSNFTFKPSLESIRAVNGSEIYFGLDNEESILLEHSNNALHIDRNLDELKFD